MNKTSLFCLFALIAVASASTSIEGTSQGFSFNIFSGFTDGELYASAVGLIILGAVNLLFGLKYAKAIIFMLGFGISAAGAFAFETMNAAIKANGQPEITLNMYLVALVSGIIGGCIFYFCYHCSIFTIGFVLGCALVGVLLTFIGVINVNNSNNAVGLAGLLILAGGIAGGIIALKLNDLVLIVSTSFAGASYVTWAICIFLSNPTNQFMTYYQSNRIYSLISLALAICGIIYQLKNKSIDKDDLQRASVSAPDVYVIDMNTGTEAYNPYTGRKF